jgi:serine/threonine protein kinase
VAGGAIHVNPKDLCLGCMTPLDAARVCAARCGWDETTSELYSIALPPGTMLDEIYFVGRVLGKGGFGLTYLGFDRVRKQKVAIKEYFPEGLATRDRNRVTLIPMTRHRENFEAGLESFATEFQTLQEFGGDDVIISVFDYIETNSTAYLVMEYLDGETLLAHVDQGGPLSVESALAFMEPVLKALERVHARGHVHQDVSPDNIFLTKSRAVRLLDFGAARVYLTQRTQTVYYKRGYSAPEKDFHGGNLGPSIDVYSAAATFFHLLIGEPPPAAGERESRDSLQHILRCSPVPRRVRWAIATGLALERGRRFRTMSELEMALTRRGVSWLALAAWTDARSISRKAPAWATVLSVVAMIVALGAFYYYVYYVKKDVTTVWVYEKGLRKLVVHVVQEGRQQDFGLPGYVSFTRDSAATVGVTWEGQDGPDLPRVMVDPVTPGAIRDAIRGFLEQQSPSPAMSDSVDALCVEWVREILQDR